MSDQIPSKYPAAHLEEITITELQTALNKGEFSSFELVQFYIQRIQALDWSGPQLGAVLELNPEAEEIAR